MPTKRELREAAEQKAREEAQRKQRIIFIGVVIAIFIAIVIFLGFLSSRSANMQVDALPDSHPGVAEAKAIVAELFQSAIEEFGGEICFDEVQRTCYTGGIESIAIISTGETAFSHTTDGRNFSSAGIPLPPFTVGTTEFRRFIEAFFEKEIIQNTVAFANGCPQAAIMTQADCIIMLDVYSAILAGNEGYNSELGLQYLQHPDIFVPGYHIPIWGNCQMIGAVLLEIQHPARNFSLQTPAEQIWQRTGCSNSLPYLRW